MTVPRRHKPADNAEQHRRANKDARLTECQISAQSSRQQFIRLILNQSYIVSHPERSITTKEEEIKRNVNCRSIQLTPRQPFQQHQTWMLTLARNRYHRNTSQMPLSSNTDFQRMSIASVEIIHSVVSYINHEPEMNSFGVNLIVFA